MQWNNYYLGIIVLVGLFLLYFFTFKSDKKYKAFQYPEKIYDNSTVEVEEQKEKVFSFSIPGISLVKIISGFIVIIIGLSILPLMTEEIENACDIGSQMNTTQNVSEQFLCSGTSESLIGLITLLFTIGILTAALAIAASAFQKGGFL